MLYIMSEFDVNPANYQSTVNYEELVTFLNTNNPVSYVRFR